MTKTIGALAALGFLLLGAPALAQDGKETPAPDVEVDKIDPLGDIAEDMDDATRRLDKGEAGAPAQTSQRRAIAKLDQLIASLKKR